MGCSNYVTVGEQVVKMARTVFGRDVRNEIFSVEEITALGYVSRFLFLAF